MIYVPTKMFLTNGLGRDREKLISFEKALRDASIASYNLVTVSSIFPPQAELVPREDGVKMLEKYSGGIVFCVMSRIDTDEHNRLIAAANGIAIPADKSRHGYISEHHKYGQPGKEAADYAEDLAVHLLGSTLGLEVDVDKAYNEQADQYEMSGQIIKAKSIVQSAEGKKDLWTTAISAVVFCEYK
jgi:arginine decarboxylase